MKKTKRSWIESDLFLKIISVIIAIVTWFAVVVADSSSVQSNIKDVPLNLKLQETALAQLGLNIIEIENTTVTAKVSGDYATIWKLNPDELTATVQLSSNYTEPGEYELKVVPAATSGVGVTDRPYEIIGYSPETVKVKLDKVESRSFKVEAIVTGQSEVPSGYIREDGETIIPAAVLISGPVAELDKIDKCVIEIELNQTLDKTFVASDIPVKLLDREGNEIDLKEHHLTIDNSSVQMVINVLKEKELPLSIEFLNTPRNFPIDNLDHRMSNYEITVAGPVDATEKYKELLLGFVDLSDISIQNNVFNFDLDLPDGFTNLNNIRTVTVTFDNTNWTEETFNLSNIRVLNPPTGYDIQLVTDQIYNVTMVGNSNIIKELTTDDIVVELDLAGKKELSTGQYETPVKISAPTKGLVWASGEYNVVIHVSKTD